MKSFPAFLPSRKYCSNSAQDIEAGGAFLGAGYAACQGVSICVLGAEVVFSVVAMTIRSGEVSNSVAAREQRISAPF